MKKKSLKTESEKSAVYKLYHRPPNPRQYRPNKSRIPVHERTEPIEQKTAIRHGSDDGTLQCTTNAPREAIVAQIKIENEYQWGLEAEDFDDLNPYVIEVKQEPDPGESTAPNFELITIKQEITAESADSDPVQIKQEELDIEDIDPNYSSELPPIAPISQEVIKVEQPEQPVQIKQEELNLEEVESQSMEDVDSHPPSSMMPNDPMETIVVDDDEGHDEDENEGGDPEPVHTSDATEQEQIDTICVDDSDDDEPVSFVKSAAVWHEIQPESPEFVRLNHSIVHNYEHKCDPRRIFHNTFLKRFVKETSFRGYSVKAVRLLNGGRNQFTHTYACDNCDKQCSNHAMIKQHVSTHLLKRSKKHPNLFITAECQLCFQRNIDDIGRLRDHMELQHAEEIYQAAKGQKFAVRIECRICRRWFPKHECLECGEEFNRNYGITWHNRLHRKEEQQNTAD